MDSKDNYDVNNLSNEKLTNANLDSFSKDKIANTSSDILNNDKAMTNPDEVDSCEINDFDNENINENFDDDFGKFLNKNLQTAFEEELAVSEDLMNSTLRKIYENCEQDMLENEIFGNNVNSLQHENQLKATNNTVSFIEKINNKQDELNKANNNQKEENSKKTKKFTKYIYSFASIAAALVIIFVGIKVINNFGIKKSEEAMDTAMSDFKYSKDSSKDEQKSSEMPHDTNNFSKNDEEKHEEELAASDSFEEENESSAFTSSTFINEDASSNELSANDAGDERMDASFSGGNDLLTDDNQSFDDKRMTQEPSYDSDSLFSEDKTKSDSMEDSGNLSLDFEGKGLEDEEDDFEEILINDNDIYDGNSDELRVVELSYETDKEKIDLIQEVVNTWKMERLESVNESEINFIGEIWLVQENDVILYNYSDDNIFLIGIYADDDVEAFYKVEDLDELIIKINTVIE